MKKIRSNAKQVLLHNYIVVEDKGNSTIAEYCNIESQSDPGFYRWLFDDDDISDFGSNLTEEDKKQAADFFNTL